MASISLSREPFSPNRAAPFSIQDFSDLVSSAFNLAPPVPSSSRPASSLQPDASLSLPQSASGVPPSPSSSCFDADSDSDSPTRSSRKANRSSAKPPMASEQSPKSRSAFSVLRRVRSRASAMLRQANTHLAPPSEGADRSARPSVSSQRTLQSSFTTSSYAFLSRPPSPMPTPRGGSPFLDLQLSRTRSRAKSFTGQGPSSLLKLPKRDGGASSVSASQAPGASAQADTEALPSFFETTGYAERNPQPPAYSRPGTPVLPVNVQAQPHVHTRLPPLRKAKSASTSLFRGKKAKGQATGAGDAAAGAQPRIALDWTVLDSEEYFTSPRHPPPVPPLPKSAQASRSTDPAADEEGELVVPAYVFERRGSATSTCTTSTMASSKSTSSLSERIASVFQSKAKLRARSKLSLAITTATADSSPSTDSTRTWSPVTPTGGFAFPSSSSGGLGLVYSQSEQGHGMVYEEDASKIGRVLTPEPDPFAKADVAVARFSTDATPRAVSPSAKYGSRRGSRQDDRRTRKARSTQQGWDFKDASPEIPAEDEDVSQVYSRARSGPSVGRGRIPDFVPESPSPKSPVYEFPSSCSIYPARGMDTLQSPLLAGPAARTRANLVSRFSMSTDSLCSRSTFSAEHQGLKDVDVDATFVFGSPMPDADADDTVVRGVAPRSPSKRATLGVCASPKAEKPAIARSSTRASLPSSPLYARRTRRAQRIESVPDATTRRQASVRTSASEPPLRAQRPSSPFPLVRGVSDGSQKARPGMNVGDKAGCLVGDLSVNDSGMYCGIVMQEETTQYAEAFEDSFVLSGEEMEHLQIPVSSLPSQDLRRFAQECRAFDADEDALTPRPISPARSFLSANVPPRDNAEDTDRTVTVGPAACEWDRRTTEPSECSTGSSTFFSARSSVESARRSV